MPWDRGIPFETLQSLIINKMKRASNQTHKCYYSILLIQLYNGARVSEAVRAYTQYIRNGETIQYVKVSKKRSKEDKRIIKIPPDITLCPEFLEIDEKKIINRIKQFALAKLKVNTHTLRYAFITYLVKQGVPPTIVAKITKHSKLDFILSYTQEKEAEELIKKLDFY